MPNDIAQPAARMPLRFDAAAAALPRPLRFETPDHSGCRTEPLQFKSPTRTKHRNKPLRFAGEATRGSAQPTEAATQFAEPIQREVIDEEQLKRMMQQDRGDSLKRNKHQVVTIALIVINVVVFVVEMLLNGFNPDISTEVLITMGAMFPLIVEGPADLWRFVAPMFLHMDLFHLLMNMVAVYSVGISLSRILGSGNFLLLYFVSGITGNVASYCWGLLAEGGMTVSAGASTSVFGIFVAVAMLAVVARGNRSYLSAISKSMLGIILVNVVYSLIVPGISISGHLGGAIGGVFGMLMVPSKNLRTPVALRIVVAIVWVALIAAGIWWGIDQVPAAVLSVLG